MALSKRSVRFRLAARAAVEQWRGVRYRRYFRAGPVDDKLIIFESFQGKGYSCSPKALYLAMAADPRFDDYTLVWAFRKPWDYQGVSELGRATIVSYASAGYAAYHARAKYWVTNSIVPVHMEPRRGQVYIQTWHGTPLKRLGCDILEGASGNVLFSAREIHRRYVREGARLTYLLSPSAFATEKFTSAFGLDASGRTSAIIEEGYPRNDFLAMFEPRDAAAVKERLGIPPDKVVVLYAPTFRDDQHSSATGYTFDLGVDFGRLRAELGDGYVVLFRAHYLVASEFDFAAHQGFVYDVSGVDDINELYIASDMLVTDYSSVFFDYANLRRPIVFFMYDLERYADELRGIYLDVADLPGPIARTQEELVAAVRSAGSPAPELVARYRLFNERFTYLDDGHASERVIARVFGPAS
jgi:CDP-glycerol glycerophosphotransferase